MSDTSDEGGRRHWGSPGVQRLEKILSKHCGEPHHSDTAPSRTSLEIVTEQPLLNRVSVDGLSAGTGHKAVRVICGMYSRVHEQLKFKRLGTPNSYIVSVSRLKLGAILKTRLRT